MPTWLLDLTLMLLLVAGEAVAAVVWFFRGSWDVCRGRQRPAPPRVVAGWLAGFLVLLLGTGAGLLRLGLPVAATAQAVLAAPVALLLVLGAVERLRRRAASARPGESAERR
ncbi:hypothetical protein [Kitasatospora sp. NPDC057500]|uniref:hypothetical protein n=1 Tax=Kitasatospora sp. NPDC057500 TaxID=3346151 RepID=UPI003693C1AD